MVELNLRSIVEKNLTACEVMVGREKIDTEEIIRKYPNGIHINAYGSYIDIEGEVIYAYSFKEEPKKFAFAGLVIKENIFASLEEKYTQEEVNEALQKEPLGIKLSSAKTKKKGREITKVELI